MSSLLPKNLAATISRMMAEDLKVVAVVAVAVYQRILVSAPRAPVPTEQCEEGQVLWPVQWVLSEERNSECGVLDLSSWTVRMPAVPFSGRFCM